MPIKSGSGTLLTSEISCFRGRLCARRVLHLPEDSKGHLQKFLGGTLKLTLCNKSGTTKTPLINLKKKHQPRYRLRPSRGHNPKRPAPTCSSF